MLGDAKVPGSVLIFGRVAAPDVAALLTNAQVHPSVAEGYAFGADIFGGGFEASKGREVLAGFGFGHGNGGWRWCPKLAPVAG